jgi:hypothetical protein
MTMIITHDRPGAFAHLLPPKAPTAMQLAVRLIRQQNAARSGCLRTDTLRQFNDTMRDTEEAFYAALERETGIDRELMSKLGGAL